MPTSRDPQNPRASATVQEAIERLNQASSNLRSLLDQPIPVIMDRNLQQEEYAGEAATNRAKRRKLDTGGHSRYGYHGEVVPGQLQMRILCCDGGYHQDNPPNTIPNGRAYGEDNILRNDKSVYCTHRNRCNIVLCHQGETPFTVRKIIIKAPPRGFTSPIQEGMIFISMDNAGELLKRTNQYQIIEESSEPPAYAPAADSDNDDPIHPSIRRTTATGRPPSRRAEAASALPGSLTTFSNELINAGPMPLPRARSRMIVDRNGIRRLHPDEEDINLVQFGLDSTPNDYTSRRRSGHAAPQRPSLTVPSSNSRYTTSPGPRRRPRLSPYAQPSSNPAQNSTPAPLSQAAQMSAAYRANYAQRNATASPSPVPPASPLTPQQDKFTVTMDCSDSSEDDEELSSPDILADLYRRDRSLYIDHSLDIDEDSDENEQGNPTMPRVARGHSATLGAMRDVGRRELPSRVQVVDLANPDDQEQDGGQSSRAANGRRHGRRDEKGVLAPHARFFIEKEKSSVSVTFEPEVSGRYILLKLWSTAKGQNIDIQSVIVKGFAGPRFFPTAEFL